MYDSPSGAQQFQHVIPSSAVEKDGSVDGPAKRNYLSQLRLSSKKLQEDINAYLTDKMEEDKRASGLQKEGAPSQKTKDELEEENYGEEPEEDET